MHCVLTAELVTQKTKETAVTYLASREVSCVSLMERLLNHSFAFSPSPAEDRFIMVTQKGAEGSPPLALCMFSPSGLVLHSIAFDDQRAEDTEAFTGALKHCIKPYFEDVSINRLLGDDKGCRFIRSLYGKTPVQAIEYHLLRYNRSDNAAAANLTAHSLTLGRAGPGDIIELLPLQEAYEREEVIPPGGVFNPDISRMSLSIALETQLICTIRDSGGKPVAKAGTNAQGLNWNQLGGVYTLPAWRSKGLARTLVRHLAETIAAEGRQTALFVRKDNGRARRAYDHAGFVYECDYNIDYYRL